MVSTALHDARTPAPGQIGTPCLLDRITRLPSAGEPWHGAPVLTVRRWRHEATDGERRALARALTENPTPEIIAQLVDELATALRAMPQYLPAATVIATPPTGHATEDIGKALAARLALRYVRAFHACGHAPADARDGLVLIPDAIDDAEAVLLLDSITGPALLACAAAIAPTCTVLPAAWLSDLVE